MQPKTVLRIPLDLFPERPVGVALRAEAINIFLDRIGKSKFGFTCLSKLYSVNIVHRMLSYNIMQVNRNPDVYPAFSQRDFAAFLAISFRLLADNAAALALPPNAPAQLPQRHGCRVFGGSSRLWGRTPGGHVYNHLGKLVRIARHS